VRRTSAASECLRRNSLSGWYKMAERLLLGNDPVELIRNLEVQGG
jgi:hypothetical protein